MGPGRRARPGNDADRGGFTILELIVALMIFGVVVSLALAGMSGQLRDFRGGLDRMVGLQTARFSVQALELDIPTAGTNVPAGQPSIVYAGETVFAFHGDYAGSMANDPFTVYHDPGAPPGTVSAPTSGQVLPGTSFQYPDTVYTEGGALSPAELIVFFFSDDTTTARNDDFALFRQVNHNPAELVARHILQPDSAPFFRYFTVDETGVDSIPSSALPLSHSVPIHLSAADTGALALIDSIRAIRVTLKATNNWTGSAERTVELARLIRLPNAEVGVLEACGSTPILGSGLTATLGATESGEPAVELQWSPATDEGGGEDDVVRYVVWRRTTAASVWADPYLSIPAGQGSYEYLDAAVEPGVTYRYGLAAQDCTPSLSSIVASGDVTIPSN